MSLVNTRVVLQSYAPKDVHSPSLFSIDDSQTVPDAATLQPNQVLVKAEALSIDPHQRRFIDVPDSSNKTAHRFRYPLGEPIVGIGAGTVVASTSSQFSVGDWVRSEQFPWQEYAVFADQHLVKLPKTAASIVDHVGVFGMPAFTAFLGITLVGQPKAGETMLVSAAAGAVGQVAVQLGKARGLRVVGVAGSDDKVEYVNRLGADKTINYRTCGDFVHAIKQAAPEGIDIYFDNVGGEFLDAALLTLNPHARVALCGSISTYASDKSKIAGIKNLDTIIVKQVTLRSFHYQPHLGTPIEADFLEEMAQLVAANRMQFKLDLRQALDQYIQLLNQQDASPKADDVGRSLDDAGIHTNISYGKLHHIFRLIDDQLNFTQESLPDASEYNTPPAVNDAMAVPLSDMPEHGTSVRPMRQLRKGKRNLRKSLQPPARSEQTPDCSGGGGNLNTIQAQPAAASSQQRPRYLGIFNKGKAVASSRIGKFYAAAQMTLDSSAGYSSAAHALCVDSQQGVSRNTRTGNNVDSNNWRHEHSFSASRHAARKSSASSGYSACESFSENRSIVACSHPRYEDDGAVFVSQPRPQSQTRQVCSALPASPSAVHTGSHMSEDVELSDIIPGEHVGVSALDTSNARMCRFRLLNSIDECLYEDTTEDTTLPRNHSHNGSSSSLDDLNLSMLFEEPDTGEASLFHIHNCSQDTLSAFNSSFFASQDLRRPRCTGDITVSDFGNSDYGLALNSATIPPWATHGADSMTSVDTLPEYKSRSDLPPPYPCAGPMPRTLPNDSIYDIRRSQLLPTSVHSSVQPSSQQHYMLSNYSSSAFIPRTSVLAGSRALMDSYDPIDFRPLSQHMY
ncbi:hypothetical protein EV183_003775 [Coemansia sp. RSA 2336]|nr:hypothetical protein EV183_003775 [Coemansia sp. RSA 2336]